MSWVSWGSAGAGILNSADLAKIALKSMVSRPHENEALKKAGVLQYKYITSESVKATEKTEGASVELEGDIDKDDYAKVILGLAPRKPSPDLFPSFKTLPRALSLISTF